MFYYDLIIFSPDRDSRPTRVYMFKKNKIIRNGFLDFYKKAKCFDKLAHEGHGFQRKDVGFKITPDLYNSNSTTMT